MEESHFQMKHVGINLAVSLEAHAEAHLPSAVMFLMLRRRLSVTQTLNHRQDCPDHHEREVTLTVAP